MNVRLITTVLGTIGTLFFIAMAFSVIPSNVGLFLGVACYVIAGGFWRYARREEEDER